MKDYIAFFSNWLGYTFSHDDEKAHRDFILAIVSEKYITNDEDVVYWGNQDCLTMYRLANKELQKRLWNPV